MYMGHESRSKNYLGEQGGVRSERSVEDRDSEYGDRNVLDIQCARVKVNLHNTASCTVNICNEKPIETVAQGM